MLKNQTLPDVVLICHASDPLDTEGLASWLACTMNLAGLVVLKDAPSRIWSVAKREIRRVGWAGFADVVAFRLFSKILLSPKDAAWKRQELDRLRTRYPADLSRVPRVEVTNPNSEEARVFMLAHAPDIIIARCKFILKPEIFEIARVGSFALHPGVCPEYRNAHGCFWALANRDTTRVGMTMLKLDKGIDTGPVYFQAGCDIDELKESHTVIQYRVVLENLDAIGRTLIDLWRGLNPPTVPVEGRASAVWGQPRLTDYLRWKRLARQERRTTEALPCA
jgi:methionyl-tRNA formyltransferase